MKLILLILLSLQCFAQGLTLRDASFVARRRVAAGGGGGGTPSTLDTGIISFWKLGEGSGNSRLDSAGTGNSLSEVGSVGSAAGILGNAANFSNYGGEYLSHADNASLSCASTDYTFAGWFYLDVDEYMPILGKLDEYLVIYSIYDGGLFFQNVQSDHNNSVIDTISYSINTWYFFVAWQDGSNIKIQVNNGTIFTTSAEATRYVGGSFSVGDYAGLGDSGGRIDEIGFWKRILTVGERTELYNSGAGVTCCPFPPH